MQRVDYLVDSLGKVILEKQDMPSVRKDVETSTQDSFVGHACTAKPKHVVAKRDQSGCLRNGPNDQKSSRDLLGTWWE